MIGAFGRGIATAGNHCVLRHGQFFQRRFGAQALGRIRCQRHGQRVTLACACGVLQSRQRLRHQELPGAVARIDCQPTFEAQFRGLIIAVGEEPRRRVEKLARQRKLLFGLRLRSAPCCFFSGDKAHRTCEQNYRNAHAAYCSGRSAGTGSTFSGGGNRALQGMQALSGAMGAFLGMLQQRESARDAEFEELRQRQDVVEKLREIEENRRRMDNAARLKREEEQLERRREALERQEEADDRRRRCAAAGAFADPAACGANQIAAASGKPAPDMFDRYERDIWDSVTQQRCPDGLAHHCISDTLRVALADSGGRNYVVSQAPVNYDALVLSVDDYRRIAAGADPDALMARNMQARILQSINERYERMMREAK